MRERKKGRLFGLRLHFIFNQTHTCNSRFRTESGHENQQHTTNQAAHCGLIEGIYSIVGPGVRWGHVTDCMERIIWAFGIREKPQVSLRRYR